MRKRYKKKKRSCGLCKPHKTNGAIRWNKKDLFSLGNFEKQRKQML